MNYQNRVRRETSPAKSQLQVPADRPRAGSPHYAWCVIERLVWRTLPDSREAAFVLLDACLAVIPSEHPARCRLLELANQLCLASVRSRSHRRQDVQPRLVQKPWKVLFDHFKTVDRSIQLRLVKALEVMIDGSASRPEAEIRWNQAMDRN